MVQVERDTFEKDIAMLKYGIGTNGRWGQKSEETDKEQISGGRKSTTERCIVSTFNTISYASTNPLIN